MAKRIIGISGVASSGKDTFLELLSEHIPLVKRFALADNLKKELNPFFKEQYGVDIFSCPREMKEVLRPILVVHGKMRRMATQGRHWTELLQKEIEAFQTENPDGVAVVTDVRYDTYEKDEIFWLKKELGGVLVHLQRYVTCYSPTDVGQIETRKYIEAPNEDERQNDPRLQEQADFKIVWPTTIMANGKVNKEPLKPYVSEFINFFKEKNGQAAS